MATEMDVEIVAVEREVWSGKATFVFTRTASGEIGIFANHIPLVAQLVDDAAVKIEREGSDDLWWAVDGGFLSISDTKVSILVESAQGRADIDERKAKEDSHSEDPRVAARGRGRLRALGQTV